MSIIMECRDLTKRFGCRTAVDHVNLSIAGGHIIGHGGLGVGAQ